MREGWKGMKIADICEKASSNIALNKIQDIDGDYPIYGASGYIKNVDFYHRDKAYIGVVKDGSGVGRVNTYPPMTSLLGTMQYILPKDGYCLGYVAYALKSLNLASFASGAAIPHIYFRDYGQCEICVPSIQEQERIVAELDLLTGIIDKQKQQLKELDTLAQSVYHSMFNDKIAASEGWRQCKVGDVYKFQYGKGNRIPESKGNYPCYGSNGMVGYHIHYNSEDAPIIGHIGAYAGIVNWGAGKHFVTYNGVMCWLKSKQTNPIYGYYMLKSQNYLEMARNGMAQPFVSYDKLEAPTIYLPPLSLQESFAKKIQSIESQKKSINRSIAESQKLFDYTMDKYFG